MDTRPKTFRVVVFLSVTLVILVTLYLLVFRVDFSGSTTFKVRFDYIGSIQVGSPVRKSGVKIGSVRAIEIDPTDQKTVFVTLALYPGQIVRASDKVSIVSGGILGDQYVEIFPGDPSAPILSSGAVIQGEKSVDLHGLEMKGEAILGDVNDATKVLANFLTRNQASMDRIVANVDKITQNLVVITDQAKSLGTLVPYIHDKVVQIGDQLSSSVSAFNGLLDSYQKALSPSLDDFQTSLKNIRSISNDLHNLTAALDGPDSLTSLLRQPQTMKDVSQTLSNVRDVSDNLKKISDELQKSLK
ncbi:MAG: MCE family protein [Spirochaetales bacterium]|nr:MCE family protein [Spirochaetales bacterium]